MFKIKYKFTLILKKKGFVWRKYISLFSINVFFIWFSRLIIYYLVTGEYKNKFHLQRKNVKRKDAIRKVGSRLKGLPGISCRSASAWRLPAISFLALKYLYVYDCSSSASYKITHESFYAKKMSSRSTFFFVPSPILVHVCGVFLHKIRRSELKFTNQIFFSGNINMYWQMMWYIFKTIWSISKYRTFMHFLRFEMKLCFSYSLF